MAIGHVELNTAMTGIQDYSTQRYNEEQRGAVQQDQFQNQFNKELNQDIRQVVKTEQSEYQNRTEYQNKKFDARDKGSNQYLGDGGKQRKKKEQQTDKVIPKKQAGFDIKI